MFLLLNLEKMVDFLVFLERVGSVFIRIWLRVKLVFHTNNSTNSYLLVVSAVILPMQIPQAIVLSLLTESSYRMWTLVTFSSKLLIRFVRRCSENDFGPPIT